MLSSQVEPGILAANGSAGGSPSVDPGAWKADAATSPDRPPASAPTQTDESTMSRGLVSGIGGFLIAATCLATPARGAAQEEGRLERFEYRRLGMGVEAHLVLWAPGEDQALRAARAAYERLDQIEAATSDYLSEGPLVELLAAAPRPVVVPEELLACVSLGLEVSRRSGGALLVDGAALTHLWRAARSRGAAPEAAAVEQARARTGRLDASQLDIEGGTLRLDRDASGLDLGGIAKGYAAGELLTTLAEHGLERALVDLGGDLAVGAAPPGSAGWRVRVGSGDPARSPVLELERCAVATSGSTEQGLEQDGRRFSHLIDPRTGFGLEHRRVVSVIAPDAGLADALASACSVLSTPAAEALVASYPEARLIQEHADSRSLFDGASLAGWTTRGGRYDGQARWSVEHGELVGRTGEGGEGGLIYTESMHSAFELELEVKLDYPYDSGVFTNMLPPDSGLKGLQVTLDHRPGGEIAGIYADGWLEHNPQAERHFVKDAWNRVRVRQTGFDARVEVWVNDVKVTDFRLPPGAEGFARHGRIGLQVHGADAEAASRSVRFRRIFLRELPILGEGWTEALPLAEAGVATPSPLARAAGWRDLLEGGVEGFVTRGDAEGYEVERGVLSIPASGGGELASVDDFGDFELSLEFAIARMANSGLYLRGDRAGQNPSYQGYEVQILDDFNWERVTNTTLIDYQKTGGLYAIQPPAAPKPYRPPGEWNRFEVLARGTRLAVGLNGLVLYDLDLSGVEASPPTSERPEAGFLGLQRYGADTVEGQVALRARNWFVRPLD
jgi:thiamine biosynthesis lipoprotein